MSTLAAEQAGASLAGGLQARLDRADLAGGVGVVGLEREDLLEVVHRLPVAAEHALDTAEVEPRALGAIRLEHRALEGLAGLGADRRLVARGAEHRPREHGGVVDLVGIEVTGGLVLEDRLAGLIALHRQLAALERFLGGGRGVARYGRRRRARAVRVGKCLAGRRALV